jgi:hypothetical protein
MTKIAIIDDLIQDNCLKYPVIHYRLENGCFRQTKICSHEEMAATHGTLVAKVLQTYAMEYEIISIQILDNWFKQRTCSAGRLIAALEFCSQLDVDVVHCSIGTERLSRIRQVRDPLAELLHKKIPVIAAGSNAMYRTIPASCNGVVGVLSTENSLLPPGRFVIEEDLYLGIGFAANYELIGTTDAQYAKSSSLAAPVVTASVNELLNSGVDYSIDAIITALKRQAWTDGMSDHWIERPFRTIETVPVAYLVNIFAQDEQKQIELLDIFAEHGYEAFGITDVNTVNDVRVLNIKDLRNQPPAQIIRRTLASVRTDLLLVFLTSADWHDWGKIVTQDSIVLHSAGSDDMNATDPYLMYLNLMNYF